MKKNKKGNDVQAEAIALYHQAKAKPQSELDKSDDSVKLLSKIAKSTTESEFIAFAVKNEIPTVKLTSKEMELLKAGKGWFRAGWYRDGRGPYS